MECSRFDHLFSCFRFVDARKWNIRNILAEKSAQWFPSIFEFKAQQAIRLTALLDGSYVILVALSRIGSPGSEEFWIVQNSVPLSRL